MDEMQWMTPPPGGYRNEEPEFRWNWGAFCYNWIFGFANKAWLTFLCFVPVLSIVWIFVSGFKGEKWAWESGEFEDSRTFRAVMRSWNRAGLLSFILAVVGILLWVILGVGILSFGMVNY